MCFDAKLDFYGLVSCLIQMRILVIIRSLHRLTYDNIWKFYCRRDIIIKVCFGAKLWFLAMIYEDDNICLFYSVNEARDLDLVMQIW